MIFSFYNIFGASDASCLWLWLQLRIPELTHLIVKYDWVNIYQIWLWERHHRARQLVLSSTLPWPCELITSPYAGSAGRAERRPFLKETEARPSPADRQDQHLAVSDGLRCCSLPWRSDVCGVGSTPHWIQSNRLQQESVGVNAVQGAL